MKVIGVLRMRHAQLLWGTTYIDRVLAVQPICVHLQTTFRNIDESCWHAIV